MSDRYEDMLAAMQRDPDYRDRILSTIDELPALIDAARRAMRYLSRVATGDHELDNRCPEMDEKLERELNFALCPYLRFINPDKLGWRELCQALHWLPESKFRDKLERVLRDWQNPAEAMAPAFGTKERTDLPPNEVPNPEPPKPKAPFVTDDGWMDCAREIIASKGKLGIALSNLRRELINHGFTISAEKIKTISTAAFVRAVESGRGFRVYIIDKPTPRTGSLNDRFDRSDVQRRIKYALRRGQKLDAEQICAAVVAESVDEPLVPLAVIAGFLEEMEDLDSETIGPDSRDGEGRIVYWDPEKIEVGE